MLSQPPFSSNSNALFFIKHFTVWNLQILFRGIVFRSMQKVFPVWISVILSAAMFGAYHMNIVQAVYATFMGIIAAIIYDKTNHLIYPILVHAANNFVGVIQTSVPSETEIFIINIFLL